MEGRKIEGKTRRSRRRRRRGGEGNEIREGR